jgi:hypothetical protein
LSESLNRVTAEISSTKDSLVLTREKVPPTPHAFSHPFLPLFYLSAPGQRQNRPAEQINLFLRACNPSVARVRPPAPFIDFSFAPFFIPICALPVFHLCCNFHASAAINVLPLPRHTRTQTTAMMMMMILSHNFTIKSEKRIALFAPINT